MMRWGTFRSWSTLLAATMLVASLLLSGSTPALANKDCNPSQSADVSLTQTLTNTTTTPSDPSTWTILKEVTAINGGPCHVPAGVTFTDILPSGANFVGVVTTPNSWNCPAPVGGILTCTSTASMGVPGTQTFDITFTIAAASPNVTDTAYITIDPRSGVTDPILDNNCSNAGYVGDNGGTVSTGDPQKGTGNCPGTNASQVEQVTFTEFAGSVDIHETDKKCSAIGRCIHFAYNSDPSVPPPDFTKVFVMNLAAITAAGQTYGSVGIFWVEGNTVLSSCGANPATNPCVTDKTKFKIGGATFVKITIYGKAVPDGGYGWQ